MPRFSNLILCLCLTCMLWTSGAATADIIQFSTAIDGAQADDCNGTGSAGTGSGTLTLDTATGIVSFNITFSGLGSDETNAHVHGAAAECAGAGVIYGIGLGSPKVGNSAPLDSSEQADMIAGRHYVNIHSVNFGGGEIRGQVLPVPPPIPAASRWGVAIMGILITIAATLMMARRRPLAV